MRYTGLILVLIALSGAFALAQDNDFSLPITENVDYIVRPADTLDGIGALFDVSPACIADTNEITDARSLRPGDSLLITVDCPLYGDDARDQVYQDVAIPREVVTFEDSCTGYRVQRNDSIDLIGFNLDVAPLSIAAVNELEPPYVLQINQCLEIPEGAPGYESVPALTNVDGSPVNQDSLGQGGGTGQYVIQPRDSLDLVAQELDVSLQAILIFNNIEDPRTLTAGTVVFIPADAPPYGVFPAIGVDVTGSLYVVSEDDTLESIAQQFDIAQVALEVANELDSDDDLIVGETITIPYNVPAFGDDDDFDPSVLSGQGGGAEIHVVQPRETVDGIAAFYNVDRQCLLDANEITRANLIQPGTPLVIDRNCPVYTGDGRPAVADVTSPAEDE